MRYRLISSFLILFCALLVSAQNRIFYTLDSINYQALSILSENIRAPHFTRVAIGDMRTINSHLLQPQRGKNTYSYGMEVESKHTISSHLSVWGYAHYIQTETTQITWNESNDIDRIGPYALGDSIGGKRYSENYEFIGGFLHEKNHWIWGAQMSYQAQLYYGKEDPRPKNTNSNLRLEAFSGYHIIPSYIMSVGGFYERYKQSNNLKYFNELGVYPSFHLTGLDSHYARFKGTNNSIFFEGNKWGINTELLPNKQGIHVLIDYEKSQLEKLIPSHNHIVLNQLDYTKTSITLAYNQKWKQQIIAYKLKGSNKDINGYTYLYGDAANNEYPFLLKNLEYTKTQKYISAQLAFYGPVNKKLDYQLQFHHKYVSSNEQQLASHAYRIQDYSQSGCCTSVSYSTNLWQYDISASLDFKYNIHYSQHYKSSEVSSLIYQEHTYYTSNNRSNKIGTAIHYKGYKWGEIILSASYMNRDWSNDTVNNLRNISTQKLNINLAVKF